MGKSAPKPDNTMDQIRQLLFGQQVELFSQKFDEIEQAISNLTLGLEKSNQAIAQLSSEKKDISEKINQLDIDFRTQLDDLDATLKKMIAECDHRSVARSVLADYLTEMGEKLRSSDTLIATNGQAEPRADE